jgi:hypothetical protein
MADNQNAHNPLEGEKPELFLNIHDNTDEQISIVVVHHDRPEYLNICLQSIAVNSNNNNYELIVVDNNSGQETQDFLKQLEKECKVIRNEENYYFSKAANIGAQHANPNSKYLLFLHSDVVILNPAWIDLMINVSEAGNSGLVGIDTSSYYMSGQKIDFIQEYCVLMTKECYKGINGFCEELPMIGNAFVMTILAQQLNFKPQVMKNNILHHYKIFGLDVNVFERMTEQAMSNLPKILQRIQTRQV